MTTDEAELTLAQFLDRAMVSNLTQVTVIHGKGTGAVRKAVHAYLKRCKGVASFRLGRSRRGRGRRDHRGVVLTVGKRQISGESAEKMA